MVLYHCILRLLSYLILSILLLLFFILYSNHFNFYFFFFFKQKPPYEMRISDWSSDVCSSDLTARAGRDGIAIAFCATDEAGLLRDIERLMGFEIATASGERPEGMSRPARGGGNKRGGQNRSNGNGQGRGGEGRPERRERPARKPFFQAEGSEERGSRPNGGNGGRPQREARRNDDFRGQRHGEEAPRSQTDNDLASTSAFGAKKQGEGRPARQAHHRK